jgi:hypothetical protein
MVTESLPTEISKALQHLVNLGKDGWWPYIADQTSYSIEATAYSLIALRGNADVVRKASDFLMSVQLPSGGWATAEGVGEWDYTTYLALLALNIAQREQQAAVNVRGIQSACQKAMELLQDGRTEYYKPIGRALMMVWHGPAYDYPRGWPWMAKTFHWVEPTCLALFAIHTAASPGGKILQAAEQARAYLSDITCEGGGWNYGNRSVLGCAVPPMAVNTCQGILAFQAQPQNVLVRKALAYLDKADSEFMSVVETAWSALARHAVGEKFDTQRQRLLKLQASDGSFAPSIMASAMATIAVSIPDKGNPLKFQTK